MNIVQTGKENQHRKRIFIIFTSAYDSVVVIIQWFIKELCYHHNFVELEQFRTTMVL